MTTTIGDALRRGPATLTTVGNAAMNAWLRRAAGYPAQPQPDVIPVGPGVQAGAGAGNAPAVPQTISQAMNAFIRGKR